MQNKHSLEQPYVRRSGLRRDPTRVTSGGFSPVHPDKGLTGDLHQSDQWPVTHTGLTGAFAEVLQRAPLRCCCWPYTCATRHTDTYRITTNKKDRSWLQVSHAEAQAASPRCYPTRSLLILNIWDYLVEGSCISITPYLSDDETIWLFASLFLIAITSFPLIVNLMLNQCSKNQMVHLRDVDAGNKFPLSKKYADNNSNNSYHILITHI
jgi:hypothetical protein